LERKKTYICSNDLQRLLLMLPSQASASKTRDAHLNLLGLSVKMVTINTGFGEMLSCIPDWSFDTQDSHAKSLMIHRIELLGKFLENPRARINRKRPLRGRKA
jgi:hypothetical protein